MLYKTLGYLCRKFIFVKNFNSHNNEHFCANAGIKTNHQMRTSASIFSKIILIALFAGSLAACNKPQISDKTVTSPVTSSETTVFINQDTLLSKYNYAKDVNSAMQTKGKAAQNDLGSRKQAFQQEVAEYQKGVNTMSADQRQTTEQRLQREQQDLQNYEQNAASQFQNENSTQANKVYDKIADFVKGYAKEKGYKIVLMYSKANPTVIYGDPSLDVTTDVIAKLNDAYAKDKK
jgi:outer membrane protein